jgi:hypothetical protein
MLAPFINYSARLAFLPLSISESQVMANEVRGRTGGHKDMSSILADQ